VTAETASEAPAEAGAELFPLGIRDVLEQTGVPVATIHYYSNLGLLPPHSKLSRTRVRYSAGTVSRIRWIRTAQVELRLSLDSIRRILDVLGQVPISELRTRLALGELLEREIRSDSVLDAGAQLDPHAVAALEELGLIAPAGPDGRRSESDQRLMQIEAAMLAAGFTEANGFAFPELIAYRDAMRNLVREETRHMMDASSRLGPAETIALIEAGMPVIDELVRFFHMRAILESLERWRSLLYEENAEIAD
jgi:DNA-binding transcriptional MerR regulator